MPNDDLNNRISNRSGRKNEGSHKVGSRTLLIPSLSRKKRRIVRRAAAELILNDPRFRILYLIPHPDQYLREAAPFQLYTPGVLETAHLAEKACCWPADIRELSAHPRHKLSFRVLRHITLWIQPIEFSALKRLAKLAPMPFIVVLTTQSTCDPVAKILCQINRDILHVSEKPSNDVTAIHEISFDCLRQFARRALSANRRQCSLEDGFVSAAEEILRYDIDGTQFPPKCPSYCNGLTAANELALRSFNYAEGAKEPIDMRNVSDCNAAILRSAQAVTQARSELLSGELKVEALNRHIVTVLLPAWIFRGPTNYHKIKDKKLRSIFKAYIRGIMQQDEFLVRIQYQDRAALEHPSLRSLFAHRYAETKAYEAGLAVLSAQDLTPVLRLQPCINQVRPKLIQLAATVRSQGAHKRSKVQNLFKTLCDDMAGLVDKKILTELDRPSPQMEGIKIVSDLPLELLNVGGVPLSLKYNCSRFPVTPGSMSFGQSLFAQQWVLSRKSFSEILVVRSFEKHDICRLFLEAAIRDPIGETNSAVSFRIEDVSTADQLIKVLNSYEGSTVIFDCHGHRDEENHAGTIVIGGSPLHVAEFRSELRVPPIVLLSSCDTCPIDGSHASSASGMLLVGAGAVLGTLLPIDARIEAVFIARLAYRIQEFLPLVLRNRPQGTDWRAFLAGMLRMAHVTEVLRHFEREGGVTPNQRDDIQLVANIEINSGNPAWFVIIEDRICQLLGKKARGALNQLTDALTHIQIGQPELIRIVETSASEQIAKQADSR